MESSGWFLQNWFELFSSLGVIAGLVFTAVSLHSETKTRRVANLLTITSNHREVWRELLIDPALARVLEAAPDLDTQPITAKEQLFVNLVILHVASNYFAMHDQLMVTLEGLRRDVGQFFSRPIPRQVWNTVRNTQNESFVAFIESCLDPQGPAV